jgi:hypothetical protein
MYGLTREPLSRFRLETEGDACHGRQEQQGHAHHRDPVHDERKDERTLENASGALV